MWFLKGSPTKITVRATVKSIEYGYQQNSYCFTVDSDAEDKMWIAIAFPWSPHKPNGSFKIIDKSLLHGNPQTLSDTNIEIHERLRSLKTNDNIELVHVQELINWYLDDIGVVSVWIDPGKTYQLNYEHKLAADSCLFLPTRLPTIIASHKPEMDYRLWVIDGVTVDLPKHLERLSSGGNMVELGFKEWGWDDDTRIHTDNWESSDDEFESSDE